MAQLDRIRRRGQDQRSTLPAESRARATTHPAFPPDGPDHLERGRRFKMNSPIRTSTQPAVPSACDRRIRQLGSRRNRSETFPGRLLRLGEDVHRKQCDSRLIIITSNYPPQGKTLSATVFRRPCAAIASANWTQLTRPANEHRAEQRRRLPVTLANQSNSTAAVTVPKSHRF
jgi:hypothetical protein